MTTRHPAIGNPQGRFEAYPLLEFSSFPAHRHLFYEIAYFARGEGVLVYDGRRIKLSPPQIHLCPPRRVWHAIECRPGRSIWTSSLAIYPRLLRRPPRPRGTDRAAAENHDLRSMMDNLIHSADPLLPLSPAGAMHVERLWGILCEELRLTLPGHLLRCRSCVEELVVLAFREHQGITNHPVIAKPSASAPLVDAVASREPHIANAVALMRNHFSRVIGNAELARLLDIDEKYFIRLFKREVGLTPQRYYLRLRLEAAAHQLVHSRLTVAEVAHMFGFASRSHFQHQFHRAFRSSPGLYRYYHRPKT